MKFRKSRPSIALSIGCMIVVSIPKRPDASPEKKTDAASARSSAVTTNPLHAGRRHATPPSDARPTERSQRCEKVQQGHNTARRREAGPGHGRQHRRVPK